MQNILIAPLKGIPSEVEVKTHLVQREDDEENEFHLMVEISGDTTVLGDEGQYLTLEFSMYNANKQLIDTTYEVLAYSDDYYGAFEIHLSPPKNETIHEVKYYINAI
ncbi:MAG: hypothetical protein LBD38_03345 [Streptococcaceae bacterium]|jgi:hypothetical protein|nr:hypothetical protein [Streptococcaceae bacterium]